MRCTISLKAGKKTKEPAKIVAAVPPVRRHDYLLHFGEFPIEDFACCVDILEVMAESPLKTEFEFYVAHQGELSEKYRGQFVVIKGSEVMGAYPSALEAIRETSKVHAPGTFFVQKCEPGRKNYTQSFHSRVAFA